MARGIFWSFLNPLLMTFVFFFIFSGNMARIDAVREFFSGLLADYVREKGASAVVKGLRAISDYDDEFRQALTNQKLNPEMETIFMVSNSEHMFLSSSVVKQVCRLGGDISGFVPPEICDDIVKRLSRK